jgi:hypothetical protein
MYKTALKTLGAVQVLSGIVIIIILKPGITLISFFSYSFISPSHLGMNNENSLSLNGKIKV